jgi:hypothetical protein
MNKLSKRTIASRVNGKLSHGPTTTAGKLRSSNNSVRHGLLAKCVLIEDECHETFTLLLDQHCEKLNPADQVEYSMVEEMAATIWRMRRLWAIETNLLTEGVKKRTDSTRMSRIAGAFSDLSRGTELHLIDRYESRLHRMYERTLKNLQLLRQFDDPNEDSGARAPCAEFTPGERLPEIPNEPRCEQPPIESETYLTTSIQESEPHLLTASAADPSPKGGESFSLLTTGPEVPPPSTITNLPELPNEPRSAQPSAKSEVYPATLNPKSEAPSPDPYEGYPRFEYDPRTAQLKRVA